jgi:hypothetical protein
MSPTSLDAVTKSEIQGPPRIKSCSQVTAWTQPFLLTRIPPCSWIITLKSTLFSNARQCYCAIRWNIWSLYLYTNDSMVSDEWIEKKRRFQILWQNFLGGTWENFEILSQESRSRTETRPPNLQAHGCDLWWNTTQRNESAYCSVTAFVQNVWIFRHAEVRVVFLWLPLCGSMSKAWQ